MTANRPAKNDTTDSVEEIEVPAPRAGKKAETIHSITDARHPIDDGVDCDDCNEKAKPSLKDRVKNLARNKQVIAGAASVLLLAVGTVVVAKRKTEAVDEQSATEENAAA